VSEPLTRETLCRALERFANQKIEPPHVFINYCCPDHFQEDFGVLAGSTERVTVMCKRMTRCARDTATTTRQPQ
jgi:hypothetical protein